MNIHSQKILGSTFGLGAVVIFGLMGYNFLSAAVWAPPTAAPASNNTETPVNIGTSDQIKNGGLGVDALSVVGGDIGITSAGPRLKMTNTTAGSMDWWLHNSATSFYLIADRNGNGNWNLPSESPWPMQVVASTSPAGDYARFSNAVRSPKYCDENGLNCFDAADVGTIVGGGLVYKTCSVVVGGSWRDTITVPATWTNADCLALMTAFGATSYNVGCIAGTKFYMSNDSVCNLAVDTVVPSNKFCTTVSPSNWRDTILVPASWTGVQCANLAAQTGAVSSQMGCITADSFTLGSTLGCNIGGSIEPTDMKFCSIVTAGNWRDNMNVPSNWDSGVCATYMSATGAAQSSLGCVLPTGAVFGDTTQCS